MFEFFAWANNIVAVNCLSKRLITWYTFFATHVENIQGVLPSTFWNNFRTAENPADIATTGATVFDVIGNDLWRKCPTWLVEKRFASLQVIKSRSSWEARANKVLTVNIAAHFNERFSSTRGTHAKVFSDNCCNPIDARNDLSKLEENLLSRDAES